MNFERKEYTKIYINLDDTKFTSLVLIKHGKETEFLLQDLIKLTENQGDDNEQL